jgi:hypothetical protein
MFTPYGSQEDAGFHPVLRKAIIANSAEVTIHDSVKSASGFAALGTAGASVLGHVNAFVSADGIPLETDGAGGIMRSTYTAASDNQTVAKVAVKVNVSKNTLYSAEVDATIGSTTGSNLPGYFMDLLDEDALDESTAAATAAQYATHGLDANDSDRAVVSIFESSVFGPLSA